MSRHSFDPEIAKQVGVNAAIIYQNIFWWVEKNAANDKHFYDGQHWTYNSISAFNDLFPYLTAKQIRTALSALEDAGLVLTGCYNQSAYDRTKWYTCGLHNGQLDLPHRANEIAPQGKPIPVSKPVVKQDTPYSPPRDDVVIPDWMPIDAWNGWLEMRQGKRIKDTPRAIKLAINRLNELMLAGHNPAEVLDQSTISGWTKLYEVKQNGKPQQNTNGLGRTAQAALDVFGDDTDPIV